MTKNLNRFYEGLIDDLSMDTDERYVLYLKEKPRTWVRDNLIFDVENLDSYYDCAGCKRRNPEAFCCSGYDVELTAHDIKVLEKRLPAVVAAYPRLERVLGGNPFWRYGDEYEKVVTRKKNDDCVFLMPGARACYLHAWALDNGIDPVDVKPYICGLYPVVVIVIGDDVIITTLNEESKPILEAGERSTSCTRKKGERKEHAIVRNQEILKRMLGKKVVAELKLRVPGK